MEKACLNALMDRSKDLQIACWLLEAWLRLRSFAGAAEGFRVITALCENFWDDLHPRIEGDDLEYRIAPINWLNEKIPVLLKLQPLTAPQSDDVKPYCWADWETACRPKRGDEKPEPADSERVTQARFQQSAMLSPTPFLRNVQRQIEAVMDATAELEAALETRCGADGPSLRQFEATLEPMRGLISGILSQRGPAETVIEKAVEEKVGARSELRGDLPASPSSSFVVGPITSRSEAYMRLEEAADYLARNEPHSPTPYLVRRAIAWGGMRLEDLLPELVQNRGELDEIYRLLQINKEKGR